MNFFATRSFAASLFAAAALASIAPSAGAKTEDLGVLGSSFELFGNNFSSRTPSFSDYYTFTIGSSGTVAGGTIEFDVGRLYNVNVTSLSLSGGTLSTALFDTISSGIVNTFEFSGLGVGTYTLAVSGSVTGRFGGAYEGVIRAVAAPAPVASAVPEPADYLMTFAGLAGVALLVRRAKAA